MLTTASCINDKLTVDNPVEVGDEITFGSSLPEEGIETRVTYGEPDAEKREFPVYWENGDEIVIYCPQSAGAQLAHYTVGVPNSTSTVAESITKTGDGALQWGSEDLHKFYGFYPAKYVLGSETTGAFKMNVPVNQTAHNFTLGSDGSWKADVNTDYAIMYAYRGQKKSNTPEGTNIDLHFTPLSTILEIVVQGPAEANTTLTLTNINVRTLDETPIVGDFIAQVIPGSDTEESSTGTVVFSSDKAGKVDNNLSIPCSWKEGTETKFVTLSQGQKLYLKAFLIPVLPEGVDALDSKNVLVSVSTTKGTAQKTLVNSNGESFKIMPNKVNRVTLPALKTNFETAYWMNSLDPDIYLTELSIPGSKMTAETADNGAPNAYQSTTIEQQYKDGVRAFILPTIRQSDGTIYAARINKPITSIIDEISNYLKVSQAAGKNEFAFVLITYQTGGSGGELDWMKSLQATINNISSDIIYKDEITANTTLGDVFGKIVVKCNYNSDNMINGAGTAPMLYTLWQQAYVEGGLPMYWNDPHSTSQLTWLYQEVTANLHTTNNTCSARGDYHFDVGHGAEATMEDKKAYIELLFTESLEAYKNGTHNTWFMNDLGGYYTWCDKTSWHLWDDNHDEHIDIINFTKETNQLGIDLLQQRTENAGLGLIFMNFANRQEDGVEYKSDLLLQTIIDNNFKFALRKKETGTTTYNADYTDGGFAIE